MKLASHRSAAALFTLLFLPALLPTLGCGTAEYEAEVNKAIARLKIENQFKSLDAAPSILAAWKGEQGPTGTKVTFRKPTLYAVQAFNAKTVNPRNPTEPLKPERLKPPFLQNFPGFVQSWEKWPAYGGTDATAVLYVGAQASEPGVADRVLGELKAAFPDLTNLAWGTTNLSSPQGKTTAWNVLSFDHEQEYWPLNDTSSIKINSTFLLLFREEQGRQVFIGARWSDTAGDMSERRDEVMKAAGTVEVALGVKID